ncbi:DUF935 domain-containing protein [Burkholderia dolosa]|uniref:DUF935 domain-containing protein n=1 Tax=Burkholderia dolosa TaxID=152500 RepID=UPI001B9B7554|nr:DUF935 domain-containing protein [Burkholderia dolosa]MBR8314661.1 DUF935 domain-containing protein [Burkholderia dolosa]
MGRIVDIHGNPISIGELREPQTARTSAAMRPMADYPVRGLTPARLNALMRDADAGNLGALADLYEEMEERDGHMIAEMSKRKRAVATLDWGIEPPRNPDASEKSAAAWLGEVMKDIPDFESVLLDLADAIGKGFAYSEIEWERAEGIWLPKAITLRPQNWFMTPFNARDDIRLVDPTGQGEPLRPFSWVRHVHKAKSGYVSRSALHRVLVWPFIFKNFAIRDLAEYLEVFGIPIRIGKYPATATKDERRTLLSALIEMGHNAAGIMPQDMEIEFKEAAGRGDAPYMSMTDWCERTQSKVILGATLTSQSDRSSNTNALGRIHNDVRLDIRNSDAKQLQSTIRRDLVYALLVLNGRAPANTRRLPSFAFDIQEPEDLKLYANALPRLAASGMRIPLAWAHGKLRIPQPERDEPVLAPAGRPEQAKSGTPRTASATRKTRPVCPVHDVALSSTGGQAVPPDGIDQLAELAMSDWQPAMSSQLAPLLADLDRSIDQGLSLDQFRERIAAQASAMPVDGIADPLARASFGVYLAGASGDEA